MTDDTEARRSRLGASDIAKLVGLSSYGDAMSVYLDKLGLVEPEVMTEKMEIGLLQEPVVAELYKRRTGFTLITPEDLNIDELRHPKHEWLGGHFDRLTADEKRVVELKTAGWQVAYKWGAPGTDHIPQEYLIQCAIYMAITNIYLCDVAVLIGGQDFRIYHLMRDRVLEEMLIEHSRRFWFENVLAHIPPELTGSSASAAYLERTYATHTNDLRLPNDELDTLAYRLRDVKYDMHVYGARRDYLENCLKAAIGDSRGIQGGDYRITWTQSRAGYRRFLAKFDDLPEE